MSLFGVPMIGWVWAGGALVLGVLWARDRWRGRGGRTGDAADTAVLGAAVSTSFTVSAAAGPRVGVQLARAPAQREGGDAVEVLRRMYGRERP